MTDAPRRKRVPRAEREQQILAAAEEVFAERGFQNTSMDEVSLRVGVSKPMLYEYFTSKEGLLLACVARIRADLHTVTVEAVSAAEPNGPRAVLEAGLEAYFDFADRHGRAWAVLLNESVIVAGPAEEAIEAIRGQQTRLMEDVLEPMAARCFAGARRRSWRTGWSAPASASRAGGCGTAPASGRARPPCCWPTRSGRDSPRSRRRRRLIRHRLAFGPGPTISPA